MTRTGAYKAIYFLTICAIVLLACLAVGAAYDGHPASAAITTAALLALLLRGRIQALFWSELLAGLHHLNQRDYARSKDHSERFLVQLGERPWLRRLIWLGTSSYSADAEVLALNNLGAAELALGLTDEARIHLARAIELDPLCPLPYRNMGTLALRTSPSAEAMPWFERAKALGLRGDWSDRAVLASQRRNASFSTTGVVATAQANATSTWEAPAGPILLELLNDDATPFEFVVPALEQVFGLTGAQAIHIARAAHRDGRAVCAAFEDEREAREKADQLTALAAEGGFPLRCAVTEGAQNPD
jgi:ATP-dependent Clp protease adaptor protein ClpS